MSAPNSSRNAVATALIAALLVLALPAMLPAEETPSDALRLTILYDNYEGSDGLVSHWGFSCLVEGLSRTILFDTGQLGGMLEYNCDRLGCELQNVDIIVLSHEHLDHAGGIETVLKHAPSAQLVHPPGLSQDLLDAVHEGGGTTLAAQTPCTLCTGARSTGVLGRSPFEQTLILESAIGLILVTGCAHPGLLSIVDQVSSSYTEDSIALIVGGFHLANTSAHAIRTLAEQLLSRGVQQVAPTHCSGNQARTIFEEVFGDGFVTAGVGWTKTFPKRQ